MDAGAKCVVIKRGDKGAYARCGDFAGDVPAYAVEPKDTTGCGDAFCAGFISSILSSDADTQGAVKFACACGAINALHIGAASAPVNRADVSAFMAVHMKA